MSGLFPEDIVMATLHVVGSNIRLVDDERLAKVFDEMATEYAIFEKFRKHPQYNYSKLLSETLQTLDLGGGILRDNAPLQYFRVSAHLAGEYGRAKLDKLQPDEAEAVRKLSKKIISEFSTAEAEG